MESSAQILSTILKHDKKQSSYKIALLRAINDVVLNFPDLNKADHDVAVPLRMLAQYWVAYYWPFVAPEEPIFQGQRSRSNDDCKELRNDMCFRPQLTALRQQWEEVFSNSSRPSDGFFLINELRIPRKAKTYPTSLHRAYQDTLKAIIEALKQPIKHAGLGKETVFEQQKKLSELGDNIVKIPGTEQKEKCLVIQNELWDTFKKMSLWVEALCIHEWCLFTERIQQENPNLADRGLIYTLLTDRPDNRISLSWERNKIDILLTIAVALCAFMLGLTVAGYTQFNADLPEHYNIQNRCLNYTDKDCYTKTDVELIVFGKVLDYE